MNVNGGKGLWHGARMSNQVGVCQAQRDCGLQPRVARNELPWEIIGGISQPQRGCGECRARQTNGNGRNRVAVGNFLRTMTQGSSCLATLGFGPESRWD